MLGTIGMYSVGFGDRTRKPIPEKGRKGGTDGNGSRSTDRKPDRGPRRRPEPTRKK